MSSAAADARVFIVSPTRGVRFVGLSAVALCIGSMVAIALFLPPLAALPGAEELPRRLVGMCPIRPLRVPY